MLNSPEQRKEFREYFEERLHTVYNKPAWKNYPFKREAERNIGKKGYDERGDKILYTGTLTKRKLVLNSKREIVKTPDGFSSETSLSNASPDSTIYTSDTDSEELEQRIKEALQSATIKLLGPKSKPKRKEELQSATIKRTSISTTSPASSGGA